MDRRESLKNLLVGAAATTALFTAAGCEPTDGVTADSGAENLANKYPFDGTRTQWELDRDARLQAVSFFNDFEKKTMDVLADLILPADEDGPSASSTGTTAFIDFMANDYPSFKLPLRAGLAWLSNESLERFGNNDFTTLSPTQQTDILEEIAYLPEDPAEQISAPVAYFDLLRKLVLTGYFSSKEGHRDLGYQGNSPNIWDGVPAEVLAKHDVDYDPAWIAKCIDHETRDVAAEWDDNMNLIN